MIESRFPGVRLFQQSFGFAMTEAMVTIVIVAFGLLGIAGLVSRSFTTEVEGTQRTQAMMLLQDMATRLEANRGKAKSYVSGDTGVTCDSTVADPLAKGDRCDWAQLLAGANEKIDTQNAAVLVAAIGCVYELDAFDRLYAITVTWQGMTAGPEPLTAFAPNACGRDAFAAQKIPENQRRVMTLPVRLGNVGS